jgi:aryl-alcohol dehydrogenase-like predicted oxidoreductase
VYGNPRLPKTVSVVGLGCSSFSQLFSPRVGDDDGDGDGNGDGDGDELPLMTVETLQRTDPRVREWIRTVRAAIEAGITVLDTAPWYGHGVSEQVIGWALLEMMSVDDIRDKLTIQTKVGRYEADPVRQFDFSRQKTLQSVQTSLQRLQIDCIDVLQLHDPEYCTSLDLLMDETIPAMMECQTKGWCKALGMTGYPLAVQHQILVRSKETFGRNIWDQSLTYGHFNLFSTRLSEPVGSSFADYCHTEKISLQAAAPLALGLLSGRAAVPDWHPAPDELKEACRKATDVCRRHYAVEIVTLALIFAFSHPGIPCTVLGLKSGDEVRTAARVARRCAVAATDFPSKSHAEILRQILTAQEWKAFEFLRDSECGPFAAIWRKRLNRWDGVQQASDFWKKLDIHLERWQVSDENDEGF